MEEVNWENLVYCLENFDDSNAGMFFEELGIRLVTMADDKGFSVLHHAVLKSRSDRVRFVIEYARKH